MGEDGQAAKSGSWWATLPGMLTAAAGLISAVTGLLVAVPQLRPTHASAPPIETSTPATNASTASTVASTVPVNDASTVEGAAPTSAAGLRIGFPAGRHAEVNGLGYNVLSAKVNPGNPGQITLAMRVRMTNPGKYGANFWSSTFRLRIGADTSAPTTFLDDVVQPGTTDIGEVDFTLPATTQRATLLVGDDPAHAIALPVLLNTGQR